MVSELHTALPLSVFFTTHQTHGESQVKTESKNVLHCWNIETTKCGEKPRGKGCRLSFVFNTCNIDLQQPLKNETGHCIKTANQTLGHKVSIIGIQ